MHVHRADISLILRAPHQLQQVFPAVDLAGVAHEELHQVEFPGGELHLLPVAVGDAALSLQAERFAHQHGSRGLFLLHRAAPAQQGPYPGLQLQDVERLGHIVVRPVFKTDDLVVVLAFRRQHDDGDLGKAADLQTGFQAALFRHHQIHDHKVDAALAHQLHRPLPIVSRDDLKAVHFQIELDSLDEQLLVVYHQYTHGNSPFLSLW